VIVMERFDQATIQQIKHKAYISKIKFKNFKSFRDVEVELPVGFIALAGPNGSGKSNVVDGIRFCLGEMATKSIRVRKASDLINHKAKKGQVSITISEREKPNKKIEVSRTIYEDGKSEYEIDGRITTRTNLIERLREYDIDVGPHNIIAQGQIEKIIDMHPKERRQIIDQIAGIAEFETKKKEAEGELNQVEQKISEAKVLAAEKESYLKELEKEKDAALEYQEKKQQLDSAKATLLWQEYTKIQNQYEDNLKNKRELSAKAEQLKNEIASLEKIKNEKETAKNELAIKIEKIGKKEGLVAQIQELKIEVAKKQTLKNEKEEQLNKINQDIKLLEDSKKEINLKIDTINTQLKQKEQYKLNLEKEIEQLKQSQKISPGSDSNLDIEKINQKILENKEQLVMLRTKKEGIQNIIFHEQERVKKLSDELKRIEQLENDSNIFELKNQIENINKKLNELFEIEKELNRKIPEYDKKLLEEKERYATLKGSINANAKNPALEFISNLKQKGLYKIEGTLIDLINSEEKFQAAIEAAAGNRLYYVVVQTLDDAANIIELLKRNKMGRCSFIPLDHIQFQKNEKPPKEAYGWLNEFVQYPANIDKAIRYVFGDTLLVENIETAKKIGINKYRMVTIDGEVIEKSGVISGGSKTSTLVTQTKISKIEQEINKIKEERDSLYAQVYNIREQSQELRKERIALELKIRDKEAEIGNEKERQRRIENIENEIKQITENIKKAENEIKTIENEIKQKEEVINAMTLNLNKIKEDEKKLKEEQKKSFEQNQKRYEEILKEYSLIVGEIETKKQENLMLNEQLKKIKQTILEKQNELEVNKNQIKNLNEEMAKTNKNIEELEAKIAEFSKNIQKEYQMMQQIEEEIKKIAQEQGKQKYELDKIEKQLNEIEIKNASVQTRLIDLKAEYEKYISIKLLEKVSKSELENMMAEAEKRINELGIVNLKAPQIYTEKKAEYEDLIQKIKKLENEKQAVLTLIKEIETKKIKLFMETLQEVNNHFKKFFKMVFKGDAELYLEDPQNPFESGLNIKIREEGQKKDKYLESLSGGEKSLLALMFIFALQMKKTSPFYIMDEADASLDKENSLKMANFISQLSKNTQFIVISHNDSILEAADIVLGVTKDEDGSKIVGVKLSSMIANS